jgi:hypothetical protein
MYNKEIIYLLEKLIIVGASEAKVSATGKGGKSTKGKRKTK